MKRNYKLVIIALVFITFSACAKRVVYNPYLTVKVKPSEQLRKETEKNMGIAKTSYKKQLEKNKETIKENNDTFFNKTRQHRFGKRKRKKQGKARL